MKAIVAILTLVASTTLGFTYKNDPTWSYFKKQFLKSYETVEEEIRRYKIFQENMQVAAYYNDVDSEASYGITKFSDRYPHELLTTLDIPVNRETVSFDTVNVGAVPTSYDWRSKGAVVSVKNQGSCGSCWAFSAVGAAEGAHYIKSGKLVSLSEQELVDCDTTNSGCNGGWPDRALSWAKSNGGFMTETAYPYVGTRSTCKFSSSKAVVKIANVYDFAANNPTKMQEYLMTYGPLAVCVDATKFNSYLSGIMTATGCSSTTVNHAVLLVGWGVDSTTSTKYWIIKNSWGTSWGESGYVRLVRGVNACGVEKYPQGTTTSN